jgi:hypothetical protein
LTWDAAVIGFGPQAQSMYPRTQTVLEAAGNAKATRTRAARAVASTMAFFTTPGRRLDLLCLALAVCYALPALFYPHGNDQSLHWYVGQGLLRGQLPFASAVSAKPIGIFVVHALASLVFGPGQAAIRIAELLTLLACAPLVARLARPSGSSKLGGEIGVAALVLFGVYYTYFDYWDTAHPELWEGTLSLGAAVVAASNARWDRRAALVGALCALALMFKHTAIVIVLPIAGYLAAREVARRPEARWRALLGTAGVFLLGALLVVIACVLPFALTGSLHAMWEVLFTAVLRYAGKARGVDGLPDWVCLEYGGSALITAGVGLLVGWAMARRRKSREDLVRGQLLLGLTVAAIGSVCVQYRFYSYHFAVAAPWLAACIVWGLRMLWPAEPRRAVATAGGLIALAFAIGPWWCSNPHHSYRSHLFDLARYLDGNASRQEYLEPFIGQNRLDHYAVLEQIGLEIKRRARPGDTLCVRGFAPPLYQVSGLRCPSRHVIEARAALPGWAQEYKLALEQHPPTFIVTFNDRPKDIEALRGLGYRELPMPSLFVLMAQPERAPDVPAAELPVERGRHAPKRGHGHRHKPRPR